MAKKGVSKESITAAALILIEEKGLAAFSLRALAASMQIQVSSLYNHISGQNELLTEVGFRAVQMMTRQEELAITGRHTDEALYALADAYRLFAKEHPELYRIIMGVHILHLSVLETELKKNRRPHLDGSVRLWDSTGTPDALPADPAEHHARILCARKHRRLFSCRG